MHTIPEILRGAIAREYAETLTNLQSADKDKHKKKPKEDPTCGRTCTTQTDAPPCAEEKNQSCNVAPKKKYAGPFVPAVQGWSEPPAARI